MTFAQKAIATGMSLVLAFGLSPLGQAPAYAAQKGGDPAQQEAPLQAQAGATAFGSIAYGTGDGSYESPALTYTGSGQDITVVAYNGEGDLIAPTEYTITVKKGTTDVTSQVSPDVAAATGYTLSLKDAADYTVVLNGLPADDISVDGKTKAKGDFNTKSFKGTISVGKLDISKLTFEQTSSSLTFNGDPITFAMQCTTKADATAGTPSYEGLKEGTDFEVELKNVTDAGEHATTVTGKGSCTGTASATVKVKQAQLLTATTKNTKDDNAELNGQKIYANDSGASTSNEYHAGWGKDDSAQDVAVVPVPYNKRSNPAELTYQVSGKTKVTLKQGSDYQVKYYQDNGSGTGYDETKEIAAADISGSEEFWGVIKVRDYSANFLSTTMKATTGQTIVAHFKVGMNSTLESFVDRVVLADGVYTGGNSAKAVEANGATFYDKDGNDVSGLVGDHFKIMAKRVGDSNEGANAAAAGGTTYGVLSTNTYNSARLNTEVKGNDNYPVGAGQYYLYVTGDEGEKDNWYKAGTGVMAEYTVLPREAVEGTAVGDLEVTASDVTYNEGNYVEPAVTVGMFTSKGSAAKEIAPVELDSSNKKGAHPGFYEGKLGDVVTNYTVTCYDASGKKVDKPAAEGTYTAEISFDGNLKGTKAITKTFKVGTGDIAAKASSIMVAERDDDGKITGFSDPSDVYTGAARGVDPDDIVFIKKTPVDLDGDKAISNEERILSEDDLAGAEFELSYSADTAAPDPGTGLPTVVGAYTVTATFSGSYTGTVSGSYSVEKLNMTPSGNALVQYDQGDGTFDAVYSTPMAGDKVEPTVRVVVKDAAGNPTDDEVEKAVYTATFGKNTKATAAAETYLKVNTGYAAYATAPAGTTAASTFAITDKSFGDISAAIELTGADGKAVKSADYTGKDVALTAKLNSTIGYLSFASDAQSSSAVVKGTATVKVTGATVYSKVEEPKTITALYYKYGDTETDGFDGLTAISDAALSGTPAKFTKKTLTTADNVYEGTADLEYSSVDLYKKGTKYYIDEACAKEFGTNNDSYALLNSGSDLKSGTVGTPTFTAANTSVKPGTATVTVTGATLYKYDGDGKYYITNSQASANAVTGIVTAVGTATPATGYTSYAGCTVVYQDVALYKKGDAYFTDAAGTTSNVTAGTNWKAVTQNIGTAAAVSNFSGSKQTGYSLRVLDEDGAKVEGVYLTTEDPYRDVAIHGLKESGTYTIVAGAGSENVYGGRVAAEFTINGIDIAAEGAFAFVLSQRAGAGTTASPYTYPSYSRSDEWTVSFDPTAAKTVKGIVFDGDGATDDGATASSKKYGTNGYLTVSSATGTPLAEGTDYEVSYENNKQAGEATVTFTGKGNYAGTVEKTFTIEQIDIAKTGYRVDFDVTDSFKVDKSRNDSLGKPGLYYTDYTGEAITPTFTINTHKAANDELVSTFDGTFEANWYNNKDVHYGRTGVDDWATVEVTATGNYKGTITRSFRIDPVTLTAENATYAVADVAYTGNVAQPKATVTWNGKTLEQGKDFAVDVAGATEVGSHTATIKQVDGGNFLMPASVTRDFKVTGLNLSNAEVKLASTSITYTGKDIRPAVASVTVDGNEVSSSLYTVNWPAAKNVGSYDVTVSAKGSGVTGSAKASFKITKAANTLKVAKASRTAKKVSKKKATVKGLKVTAKGQGTVTYKKVKVSKSAKKFTVNAKTGKITVKKGTKKGTYKVTVSAKAAGNGNYNPSATQKAVVTVKVKK